MNLPKGALPSMFSSRTWMQYSSAYLKQGYLNQFPKLCRSEDWWCMTLDARLIEGMLSDLN